MAAWLRGCVVEGRGPEGREEPLHAIAGGENKWVLEFHSLGSRAQWSVARTNAPGATAPVVNGMPVCEPATRRPWAPGGGVGRKTGFYGLTPVAFLPDPSSQTARRPLLVGFG